MFHPSKPPNAETERLKRVVTRLLPESARVLFEHPRLAAPLQVILDKAVATPGNASDWVGVVAVEAAREAMAASAAMGSLPEGKNRKALDIMRHAWYHLHEACRMDDDENE